MNSFLDSVLGTIGLLFIFLVMWLVWAVHGTGLLAHAIQYADSYLVSNTYAEVK